MNFKLTDDIADVRDVIHRIARVVYAQTGAVSLHVVEAMTSMIANSAVASGRTVSDIISDETIFDVLNPKSSRHQYLNCNLNSTGYKMCLRVALRMANGNLPDCCHGATRFHRVEVLPDWAVARGYIDDIDDVLFYL